MLSHPSSCLIKLHQPFVPTVPAIQRWGQHHVSGGRFGGRFWAEPGPLEDIEGVHVGGPMLDRRVEVCPEADLEVIGDL